MQNLFSSDKWENAILLSYIIAYRYVHNPLLLDGLKWDMRVYVLVTSFQPTLEAYVYSNITLRKETSPRIWIWKNPFNINCNNID